MSEDAGAPNNHLEALEQRDPAAPVGRTPAEQTKPRRTGTTDGRHTLDTTLPFFTHIECPYFPCHDDIDPEIFNCVFCFCPEYTLGTSCSGKPRYTPEGIKDCSCCSLPHRGNTGNRMVNKHFAQLHEIAKSNSESN